MFEMFESRDELLPSIMAGAAARALERSPESLGSATVDGIRASYYALKEELHLLGGPETPRLVHAVVNALELEGEDAECAELIGCADALQGFAGQLLWQLSAWRTAAAELLVGYVDDVITRETLESYATAEQQLRTLLRP